METTDFYWTCKSCDAVMLSRARARHLRQSPRHRDENISYEPGKLDKFFTKSAKKCKRPTTLKDYYWKCNYCSRQVVYKCMKSHLLSKLHENDNLSLVSGELRSHFTQDELLGEFRVDLELRVEDHYWVCNLCGENVVYSGRKIHLLSSKRHAKDKLSIGDASEYFKRGALLQLKGRGLHAYYWECNHCSKQVTHDSMQGHIRSRIHANDNLVGKVRDHFTQAGLVLDCNKENSEDGERRKRHLHEKSQDGKGRPCELGGTKLRVQNYYWVCSLCNDEVLYNSMKIHFLEHAKDNSSIKHERASKYFKRGAFLPLKGRGVYAYYWECNHCGKQVVYDAMQKHIRSQIHVNDNLVGKVRDYFTRAGFIRAEDDETEEMIKSEIDQVSDDEETRRKKGVQERKQRILNDVARYEAKFNCLKILFD